MSAAETGQMFPVERRQVLKSHVRGRAQHHSKILGGHGSSNIRHEACGLGVAQAEKSWPIVGWLKPMDHGRVWLRQVEVMAQCGLTQADRGHGQAQADRSHGKVWAASGW